MGGVGGGWGGTGVGNGEVVKRTGEMVKDKPYAFHTRRSGGNPKTPKIPSRGGQKSNGATVKEKIHTLELRRCS